MATIGRAPRGSRSRRRGSRGRSRAASHLSRRRTKIGIEDLLQPLGLVGELVEIDGDETPIHRPAGVVEGADERDLLVEAAQVECPYLVSAPLARAVGQLRIARLDHRRAIDLHRDHILGFHEAAPLEERRVPRRVPGHHDRRGTRAPPPTIRPDSWCSCRSAPGGSFAFARGRRPRMPRSARRSTRRRRRPPRSGRRAPPTPSGFRWHCDPRSPTRAHDPPPRFAKKNAVSAWRKNGFLGEVVWRKSGTRSRVNCGSRRSAAAAARNARRPRSPDFGDLDGGQSRASLGHRTADPSRSLKKSFGSGADLLGKLFVGAAST